MTFVVGYAPDGRGRAVLELAAMLARTGDSDLVVVSVVPQPWLPKSSASGSLPAEIRVLQIADPAVSPHAV